MAFRRPLKVDSAGNLRIMNSADLEALRQEAIRQYASNPSVVLSYDAAGTPANTIGTLTDTRWRSGGTATNISAFPNAAATPDLVNVSVTWNRIAQSIAIAQAKPIDSADRGYPLYYDGTNVRAMTDSDYLDTIIIPAINKMVSSSTSSAVAGGTYYISTVTTDPNGTLISASPVFTDTRADAAAYTAAGIPEVDDQPVNIQSYYLYQVPAPAGAAIPRLAVVRSDGQIGRESPTTTRRKLRGGICWAANSLVGNRIRYGLDSNGGSGFNRGSGMANTRLSGPSTYAQRLINTNDYRTQEFPAGTPQTLSTTYLKIRKT